MVLNNVYVVHLPETERGGCKSGAYDNMMKYASGRKVSRKLQCKFE